MSQKEFFIIDKKNLARKKRCNRLSEHIMDIQFQIIKQPSNNLTLLKELLSFRDTQVISIGRDDSCNVRLGCEENVVSRHHAQITKKENLHILTDTSSNGTYLNNREDPIGQGNSSIISTNDIVRVGGYSLKLTITTSTEAQKHSTTVENVISTSLQTEKKEASHFHEQHKQAITPRTLLNTRTPAFGNINECFSPPDAVIPENWDMSIDSKSSFPVSNVPERLKNPIDFLEKEGRRSASLIKGLGLPQDNHAQILTEKNMYILGHSLRALIEGIIEQRRYLAKVEESLKMYNHYLPKELRSIDTDKVDDFTVDSLIENLFLTEIMDNKERDDIHEIQKTILKHQSIINDLLIEKIKKQQESSLLVKKVEFKNKKKHFNFSIKEIKENYSSIKQKLKIKVKNHIENHQKRGENEKHTTH